MTEQTIQTHFADGLFTITLNRPTKYNALMSSSFLELDAAIQEAASRSEVQAIILTGAGPVFCAGLDASVIESLLTLTLPELRALNRKWNLTFSALEAIEKPVVAMLNGGAIGAGLELALACDVRIAANEAKLALRETRGGGIPDAGGCTRLARLVGVGRAKEIIMTGNLIPAQEAERIGLVNRVVDSAGLGKAAKDFARELLQGGPLGIGLAKRVIVHNFGLDVQTGVVFESLVGSHLYTTEYFRESTKRFQELKEKGALGLA